MAKKTNSEATPSGYFRKILTENPGWLDLKSNDPIRARWKQDHGQDMSDRVARLMTNVKSKLRQDKKKRAAHPQPKKPVPKPKPKREGPAVAPAAAVPHLE